MSPSVATKLNVARVYCLPGKRQVLEPNVQICLTATMTEVEARLRDRRLLTGLCWTLLGGGAGGTQRSAAATAPCTVAPNECPVGRRDCSQAAIQPAAIISCPSDLHKSIWQRQHNICWQLVWKQCRQHQRRRRRRVISAWGSCHPLTDRWADHRR